MAWISVHETIKGPKLREFRKQLGCSEFEATGVLIYLWLWGLDNATKDGLIPRTEENREGHVRQWMAGLDREWYLHPRLGCVAGAVVQGEREPGARRTAQA